MLRTASPIVLVLVLTGCATPGGAPPWAPSPLVRAEHEGTVTRLGSGYRVHNGSGTDLRQRAGGSVSWTAPPDHWLFLDFSAASSVFGAPLRLEVPPGTTHTRTLNDVPPGCYPYDVWAWKSGSAGTWAAAQGMGSCASLGIFDIRPRVIIEGR